MPLEDAPDDSMQVRATLALAHALRTPLTSLSLGLGLLDEETLGPLRDAQREIVRTLVADVARLSVLVDRALQTDRLGAYAGPVERVDVDFGELVALSALPIVEQAREKSVHIVRALPADVVVVADPVKLAWVVTAVLGNALRYSPVGSCIDVTLETTGDEALLGISDHGPGLSPEIKERIFEREGGLGLFMAREIIEAHGGAIFVRSVDGEGCEFRIALPLSKGRVYEGTNP